MNTEELNISDDYEPTEAFAPEMEFEPEKRPFIEDSLPERLVQYLDHLLRGKGNIEDDVSGTLSIEKAEIEKAVLSFSIANGISLDSDFNVNLINGTDNKLRRSENWYQVMISDNDEVYTDISAIFSVVEYRENDSEIIPIKTVYAYSF